MTTPTDKPTEKPRINTPCPACGRATLVLDTHNNLVCAAVPGRDGRDGCPDPTRLARMCAAASPQQPAPIFRATHDDGECIVSVGPDRASMHRAWVDLLGAREAAVRQTGHWSVGEYVRDADDCLVHVRDHAVPLALPAPQHPAPAADWLGPVEFKRVEPVAGGGET